MMPDLEEFTAPERRLCEVLTAYYEASEQGREPGLQTLIQQHPDLRVELTRFFADQEILRRVTGPLRLREGIDQQACRGSSSRGSGEDFQTLHDESAGVLADLFEPGQIVDGVRRFGDYELLEKLAIGGMGVVYKARQVSLNRLVALKMIRSGDFATQSDIQRFRAEAEMVADLDHPNIVPIHEVGESGGYHFFSMKLVEGGTLAAHLDGYRSDPRASARLTATLARAIHHAHQRGILHRDLKPSNIILDAHGEPLIADFGLAKRRDSALDLTITGVVVGTPPYFAPEVTLGRKGSVTTATDVYGLGAILYALLTGRSPFRADSVWELLEKVKEQPPEPPRKFNPQVDVDLQTICLKCLEKDPRARYGTAQELAEDLERSLSGQPIHARPSDWRHLAHLWCRHPARQREAGVYAVALGVLLTLWASAGITLSALGVFRALTPGAHIIQVTSFLVLAFLPMILIGLHAARSRPWAIRAGLIHGSLLLVACTLHGLVLFQVGAARPLSDRDPLLWMMSFTLFYLSVALLVAAYAVANISLGAGLRAALPRSR